jgi:hypothetical protein
MDGQTRAYRGVSDCGDVIVVGAYLEDGAAADAGAAYFFRYNGVDDWFEEDKLTASDAAAGDDFGWSVAASGDVILVGQTAYDVPGDPGAAYVYRWDGADWVEEQKLIASDAAYGNRFGDEVALQGNRALIGDLTDDNVGVDGGSAYLFEWDGENWLEARKILGWDTTDDDRFGESVALDGDLVLAGAYLADAGGIDSGAAYLLDLMATPTVIDVFPGESIQAAIDGACHGDEIVVQPGTYNEAIIIDKGVSLRSTDPLDPNVVAATVIDGTGLNASVVTCRWTEEPDIFFSGFTITG